MWVVIGVLLAIALGFWLLANVVSPTAHKSQTDDALPNGTGQDSINDVAPTSQKWLSKEEADSELVRVGIMGTVATAGLPALMAATSPSEQGGELFGPNGIRGPGGRPAEQKLYSRLRPSGDARRMWELTQNLTKVPFPAN